MYEPGSWLNSSLTWLHLLTSLLTGLHILTTLLTPLSTRRKEALVARCWCLLVVRSASAVVLGSAVSRRRPDEVRREHWSWAAAAGRVAVPCLIFFSPGSVCGVFVHVMKLIPKVLHKGMWRAVVVVHEATTRIVVTRPSRVFFVC